MKIALLEAKRQILRKINRLNHSFFFLQKNQSFESIVAKMLGNRSIDRDDKFLFPKNADGSKKGKKCHVSNACQSTCELVHLLLQLLHQILSILLELAYPRVKKLKRYRGCVYADAVLDRLVPLQYTVLQIRGRMFLKALVSVYQAVLELADGKQGLQLYVLHVRIRWIWG